MQHRSAKSLSRLSVPEVYSAIVAACSNGIALAVDRHGNNIVICMLQSSALADIEEPRRAIGAAGENLTPMGIERHAHHPTTVLDGLPERFLAFDIPKPGRIVET